MAQIRFDQLVSALADAVVRAEHLVRIHQITDLRSFFDERNQPISVPLEIQRTDPAAKRGETTKLEVPLITLINMSQLSIKEMEIQFTTSLGDVTEQRTPRRQREPTGAVHYGIEDTPEPAGSEALGWVADQDDRSIEVATSSVESNGASATITLKVQASETPEGLSRLIDRLNRLI